MQEIILRSIGVQEKQAPQISVNTLGGSYYVNVTDLNGCPGVSNPPFTVYQYSKYFSYFRPYQILLSSTPSLILLIQHLDLHITGLLVGGTIESGQGTNSIDVKWTNSGMFTFSVLETDVNGCVGEEVTLLVNIII